jgi:His-Xaa-Ser system radical SAM maturase HxsC
MIALGGRGSWTSGGSTINRAVWLLVDASMLTSQRAPERAYLVAEGQRPPDGFGLYLSRTDSPADLPPNANHLVLPPQLDYLKGGDIISLDGSRPHVRVLWRRESPLNSVLLTERCDNYCLMCSQPPKQRSDDQLLDQAYELVRLLPRTTTGIAFTGGEPTLYGKRLIGLLRLCRNLLPFAGVHVLSNGRRFSDPEFAAAYASVENPHMMVGIPIYGAEPSLHDYVVQAEGAFQETVRGILNLGHLRQRVEVRVVIHKQTAPHLAEIAEFIARNLTFVEQVALMGLEMIGFARANMTDVWIDPVDYQNELVQAVRLLDRRRIKTMIYNHQLCLLDRELWPFAVRSISDWKNEYHPECLHCSVREACGGFFFSAKYRTSNYIRAIPLEASQSEPAILSLAPDGGSRSRPPDEPISTSTGYGPQTGLAIERASTAEAKTAHRPARDEAMHT